MAWIVPLPIGSSGGWAGAGRGGGGAGDPSGAVVRAVPRADGGRAMPSRGERGASRPGAGVRSRSGLIFAHAGVDRGDVPSFFAWNAAGSREPVSSDRC
jgi:hypothetical protein